MSKMTEGQNFLPDHSNSSVALIMPGMMRDQVWRQTLRPDGSKAHTQTHASLGGARQFKSKNISMIHAQEQTSGEQGLLLRSPKSTQVCNKTSRLQLQGASKFLVYRGKGRTT
jgi:hypothetical protein